MVADEVNVKMGDRVTTKNLGALAPSNVIGIMTGGVYASLTGLTTVPKWEGHYPEWITGNVVICEFDEPVRMTSYDDFVAQLNHADEISNEIMTKMPDLYKKICMKNYQSLITPTRFAAYPIDDIEVM